MITMIYIQRLLLLCALVLHSARKTGEDTEYFWVSSPLTLNEDKAIWKKVSTDHMPDDPNDSKSIVQKHQKSAQLTFSDMPDKIQKVQNTDCSEPVCTDWTAVTLTSLTQYEDPYLPKCWDTTFFALTSDLSTPPDTQDQDGEEQLGDTLLPDFFDPFFTQSTSVHPSHCTLEADTYLTSPFYDDTSEQTEDFIESSRKQKAMMQKRATFMESFLLNIHAKTDRDVSASESDAFVTKSSAVDLDHFTLEAYTPLPSSFLDDTLSAQTGESSTPPNTQEQDGAEQNDSEEREEKQGTMLVSRPMPFGNAVPQILQERGVKPTVLSTPVSCQRREKSTKKLKSKKQGKAGAQQNDSRAKRKKTIPPRFAALATLLEAKENNVTVSQELINTLMKMWDRYSMSKKNQAARQKIQAEGYVWQSVGLEAVSDLLLDEMAKNDHSTDASILIEAFAVDQVWVVKTRAQAEISEIKRKSKKQGKGSSKKAVEGDALVSSSFPSPHLSFAVSRKRTPTPSCATNSKRSCSADCDAPRDIDQPAPDKEQQNSTRSVMPNRTKRKRGPLSSQIEDGLESRIKQENRIKQRAVSQIIDLLERRKKLKIIIQKMRPFIDSFLHKIQERPDMDGDALEEAIPIIDQKS